MFDKLVDLNDRFFDVNRAKDIVANGGFFTFKHTKGTEMRGILLLDAAVSMKVVRRTSESELFDKTVDDFVFNNPRCKLVINGSFQNNSGTARAYWAKVQDGPMKPMDEGIMGEVIEDAHKTVGEAKPTRGHLAFDASARSTQDEAFQFGVGNPPHSSDAALGGLVQMIIGGKDCKTDLVFTTLNKENRGSGKQIVAQATKQGILMVLLHSHNSQPGMKLEELCDLLLGAGFDNAVAMDGGDSVMMNINRCWAQRQSQYKNQVTSIGLAFYYRFGAGDASVDQGGGVNV